MAIDPVGEIHLRADANRQPEAEVCERYDMTRLTDRVENPFVVFYCSNCDGVRHVIVDANDADLTGWSIEVGPDESWQGWRGEAIPRWYKQEVVQFARADCWFFTDGKNGRGGWNGLGFGEAAYPWSAIVDHGEHILRWIPPSVEGTAEETELR
jgi:hypothetical protein